MDPKNDLVLPVSIIIPAYNEEDGIGMVLSRLLKIMTDSGLKYEVIVIDDGSQDNTARLVAEYPVRLMRHSRNKGYGASLKAGVRVAEFDTVVIMDADGQHDPADVPRLIKLAQHYDLVIGARAKNSHTPLLRKPGKWLLGIVANYLAGMTIPDYNSGFQAFRRETVLQFAHFLPNGFSFSTTLTLAALKEGYEVAWPTITVAPRVGISTVRPVRDGYNTLLLILRTIMLFDPLKIFLPPSFVLGIFGVLFSIYGLLRFQAFPETGVVLIVAAILMFFFGVVSDQISAIRRGLGR